MDDNEDFAFERIRHLGELARILTDTGLIFITTVDHVDGADLTALRVLNEPYEMLVIWSGDQVALQGIDETIDSHTSIDVCVKRIFTLLQEQQIIPDYSI